MIDLKSVYKIYGKKQNAFKAIDGVSLAIKPASVVAIVGKSGSGKSTLMHVMSGLDSITSGSVTIDGSQIQTLSEKQVDAFRNKKMGFIFQSFFVEANQNCIDNVSLPLEVSGLSRKVRQQRALEALKLVELTDKAKSKAKNLSGGQKQRLAIARAIINKPKLIFADEPTGNLDSATGEKIIQLLFDLNKKLGATIIVVTHDHELAARCDSQIYIKDGVIEKITGKTTIIKQSEVKPYTAPFAKYQKIEIIKRIVKYVGAAAAIALLVKVTKFYSPLIVLAIWLAYAAVKNKWTLNTSIKNAPQNIRIFGILVRRSSRSLRSAKLRTILTALAIGVGGFTLALTLAAGNGVRDYTNKLVASNFDPAELIVGRDREISNSGAPNDKPQEFDETIGTLQGGGGQDSFQVKRVTRSDVEQLRSLPYIEQVRENYQINVRNISAPGQKKYTASAQVFNSAQKPESKAGDIPKSGDMAAGTILLPDTYIELLGFKDAADAVGKEVSLTVQQPFSAQTLQSLLQSQSITNIDTAAAALKPKELTVTYKVSGVTKKAATSLSFGVSPVLLSTSDARALYDFTAKGTSDYEKYLYVFARIKDGTDDVKLQAAKSDLESKGYYVQTSKDIQKAITQFVNILQTMVLVLGMITLIASVFGVVNTQYISVLERTREIGLMKALGMSRKNISRLFILEASWIGFMGGLLGILGGTALGILLNPWITKKLELGEGNALLQFNSIQMITLLSALMLVAAFAGLLPARKAAKLDPVEALRTE